MPAHGNTHGHAQLTANNLAQVSSARRDEVGMGKYLKTNPDQDPYYLPAAMKYRREHNTKLHTQIANVDTLFRDRR